MSETQPNSNVEKAVSSTLRNIELGITYNHLKHDAWIDDNSYCLCKEEIDSDGEKVYTAYQLYIDKPQRSLKKVHEVTRFLRFYAQKQGYKRLYVMSSRLDKLKAYARGLGRNFKVKAVIFSKEF